MTWRLFLSGTTLLLLIATCSLSSPQLAVNREEVQVHPGSYFAETVSCQANEPTRAVAVGGFSSYLGLYIYDEFGNCIAKDDVAEPKTRSDLSAVWFPTKQQTYTVQVRNLGWMNNDLFLFVIR